MITLLSAPSNLGLRPPQPGSVPGAAKAPEALREAGLFHRFATLGARDGGVVLPGRYVDDDDTRTAGHVRNETAMIDHSRRLSARITAALQAGTAPLVIGGDCAVLLGAGLSAVHHGDTGLVHIDGHTDFRHPGNSEECASVAGEALAAAVGRHWAAVADIDGQGPYFSADRTAHIGHRADDEEQEEVRGILARVTPAADVASRGAALVAAESAAVAGARYWLQVDVDVLDPTVMPAVDSPDPGGLSAADLTALLRALAPNAIGASVTVFDPDLDPDGRYARVLVDILTEGLGGLGSAVHPT